MSLATMCTIPDAGHAFASLPGPDMPLKSVAHQLTGASYALGGTASGNAAAQADASPRIVAFLDVHLASDSEEQSSLSCEPWNSTSSRVASSLSWSCLCVHDGRRQSPNRLDGGHFIQCGAHEEVGQTSNAELLSVGCLRLGHAVGVEQHSVSWLERGRLDLGDGSAEAHRDRGLAREFTDEAAVTDEQRKRVPGVEPGEFTAVEGE